MREPVAPGSLVLVTGAGGFIGSHVVEACVRAGYRVRCGVNYNSRGDHGFLAELAPEIGAACETRAFDVRDPDAAASAVDGAVAVVHLAALIGIPYSYLAPSSYFAVNVQGTMHLLNAARRYGVQRFVHTSTSEVYGSAQYTPMDEAHPLVGQSPYSASKIAADKLVESYARSFELPAVTIRPFNTFGPRQSARAVLPSLARQLLDPTVSRVRAGDLSTVRDFTYVSDTAAGFVAALRAELPEAGMTINLGTGTGIRIDAALALLREITGSDKPLDVEPARIRPERSEVRALVSDNARAAAILHWRPAIDVRTGLAALVTALSSTTLTDTASYQR